MPIEYRRVFVPLTAGGLAIVLAAILSIVLGAPPAHANHVACGATITADTTLDADLLDCPNNGIVIGADDITLDLNDHLVDGDGSEFKECPKDEPCDIGVVNEGHDGVVVKDGSTREFAVGVLLSRAGQNTLRGISSSKHEFFGALVGGSSDSAIRNSSLSNNVAPEGDGLGLFGSEQIRVVGNTIRDNPGPGIHVEDSTGSVIRRNAMVDNGPAILVEASGNQVRQNRVKGGGGILVGPPGDDNVVVGNRISRAYDSLAIENGSGNLVARNVVLDARGGAGIRLGIGSPPFGGANNVVRRNLVRGAQEDAFHVYEKDGRSRLRRNVAIGASDDGFEIESRSAKLIRNRARRNDDLGIDAVTGVDARGNVARNNGDRRQCTNVPCG